MPRPASTMSGEAADRDAAGDAAGGAAGGLLALVQRLPKAELHLHVEGTLEPELIFQLAERNGVSLAYPDAAALRAAYNFTDLQSFLDLYYAGLSVLLTEEDFFDMAWACLQRVAQDNVVRVELFFDPQAHTARGVPFETVISGLWRACQKASVELELSAALLMCFLRHLPEGSALATLEEAMPWRHCFIGVGLDSSEVGNPPEKFALVFGQCRELGLHVVAHAGEEGPPEYIRTALDLLQVERVDHGIRVVEDAALLARVAAEQVPLTVCPLSNVKLCAVPSLETHPLPALLAAKVKATINADDPAYFGGYTNDNWRRVFEAFPQFGAAEAYALARNSLEATFAPAELKEGWLAQLDRVFEAAQHS